MREKKQGGATYSGAVNQLGLQLDVTRAVGVAPLWLF